MVVEDFCCLVGRLLLLAFLLLRSSHKKSQKRNFVAGSNKNAPSSLVAVAATWAATWGAVERVRSTVFFLISSLYSKMLIYMMNCVRSQRDRTHYIIMMLFSIALKAMIENSIMIWRVRELTNTSYPLLRFAPIESERSVTSHYASLLLNWSEA